MEADTLITFTAAFLGVMVSAVIVGAVFTLEYIAGNRREITDIMLAGPESGGYQHWLPYINRQKKKTNALRRLFVKKIKHMLAAAGFCTTAGVFLPGLLFFLGVDKWEFLGTDWLPFLYLIVAIFSAILFLYVSISFVGEFPRIENLAEENIDDLPEMFYKKQFRLLWDRVTIPHENPDWIWRACEDPNHLIRPDCHERRIHLDMKNRGPVILMQTVESQTGKLKDGSDLGWRLTSVSLSGPYDPKTEHINQHRGRLHQTGDYFASAEELIPLADEWLNWAIEEWRRIDQGTSSVDD